jgi:hypothetical protein
VTEVLGPALGRRRSGAIDLHEYLDPGRFPLTTQAGVTSLQQLFLDAFIYDKLKGFAEGAGLPYGEPNAVWAELRVKGPHIARLIAEVAAAAPRGEAGGGARRGGLLI